MVGRFLQQYAEQGSQQADANYNWQYYLSAREMLEDLSHSDIAAVYRRLVSLCGLFSNNIAGTVHLVILVTD